MLNLESQSNVDPSGNTPNYSELLHFLLEPLLNPSESISVDCEQLNSTQRVWLRLAVDTEDKGHIYGRGGRNLTAIRTVLNAAAKATQQSIYLDVYGGEHSRDHSHHDSSSFEGESKKIVPRRSSNSKPKIQ
jgi:predicted RNA-binding protein YlqC (UPF0109 family)